MAHRPGWNCGVWSRRHGINALCQSFGHSGRGPRYLTSLPSSVTTPAVCNPPAPCPAPTLKPTNDTRRGPRLTPPPSAVQWVTNAPRQYYSFLLLFRRCWCGHTGELYPLTYFQPLFCGSLFYVVFPEATTFFLKNSIPVPTKIPSPTCSVPNLTFFWFTVIHLPLVGVLLWHIMYEL